MPYHHDDSTASGAAAYAFRRSPELKGIVAFAATCMNLVQSLAHLRYRQDKVVEWEGSTSHAGIQKARKQRVTELEVWMTCTRTRAAEEEEAAL